MGITINDLTLNLYKNLMLKIKLRVIGCQIQCFDGDRVGYLERIKKALHQLKNNYFP